MKYPEHEKLKEIQEQSQVCGEFLNWLQNEKRIHLCTYEKTHIIYDDEGDGEEIPEGYYGINKTNEKLLAEFFNIDLDRLEQEKRQMLDELRKNQ
jgi:hypothetical protein